MSRTSELLARARRSAGLNQLALATEADIPQASVSRIEQDLISPRASTIERVRLSKRESSLPRDSAVNVSQILSLDRSRLVDHVGRVGADRLDAILSGIDTVLGH